MSKRTLKWLKCATCGESKPDTHFHQRARSKTGYAPSCRTCVNRKRRSKKATPAATGTHLKTLVKKGDLNSLKTLVEKKLTRSFDTLLNTCVTPYVSYPKTATHPKLVRFLIQRGADPDARGTHGERMLSLSAKTARPDLVEALIDGGATVNFFNAAAILDLSAVKGFLANDKSIAKATDDNGLTGLHYCAGSALGRVTEEHQERQLGMIDLLLNAGSDPNLEVEMGIAVTPLVSCCQSGGAVPVIQALVRGGAEPNHPNALRTALRHFKKKRTSENPVANALIDCGCEVDGLIDSDRTCLHLYSHHEEIQAVSWLLEHGASVHARIADGRTPLHLAAERNNNTTVVELLVGYGADIDAKDRLGKKPIDYARSNNKARIVEFLSNR